LKKERKALRESLRKDVYDCQFCPKSYKRLKEFNKHQKSHQPKVKCEICSKEIQSYTFQRHMKQHNDDKKFNCTECKAGFITKFLLERHMWSHRNDFKFNCKVCQKGFNRKEYFDQHLLIHSDDPRPLKCDLCPKDYIDKQSIIYHLIATHTTEKNFKCDKCKFSTKTKQLLSSHKKRNKCKVVKKLMS
jgi:KRAB domain-containing zinc finger protein